MSYTPTTWAAGDTVTAAKLNKLEQGVASGGGVLVVHDDENGTLDKTWQEIHDALSNGIVYLYNSTEGYNFGILISAYTYENKGGDTIYTVRGFGEDMGDVITETFDASSASGYPSTGGN